MRIANNIMAMNTHRFYTSNNNAVSKAAEKLSSGYKINRAGDDAAGLAISEKMRAQIRGLNMAKKNSQDAVSMVQTAEAALQGVHSMLQRMNQLAVQAATGTNDIDLTKANGTQKGIDRAALQQEFQNLQDEIDQVAQTTNFNQLYMLQGTGSAGAGNAPTMTATVDPADINVGTPSKTAITAADVQIDGDELVAALGTDAAEGDVNITFVANGADKIDMQVGGKTIATADVAVMGGSASTDTQELDFQTADGKSVGKITVKGNGVDTATAAEIQADVANIKVKAEVAKADPAPTPAVAAAAAAGDAGEADLGKASFTVDLTGVSMDATGKAALKIGTTVVESDTVAAGDIGDAEKIAAAFDGKTVKVGETTYTATVEGAKVKFTAAEAGKQDAGNIPAAGDKIGYYKDSTNTAGAATSEVTLADADIVAGNETAGTTPGAIPAGTYRIQVGAEEGTTLDIKIDAMNTTSLGVAKGTVKISTQADASSAITATRNAINKVSTQRAELGAMQNRLEYKIDNLANTSENLSAAESRIRDVDIAEEMTNFTKNNILSQAATAMLAQANSLPQNVLSLLQ